MTQVRSFDRELSGGKNRPRFAVSHIDHTDDLGGAELALARLLTDNSDWHPYLFIPPRDPNRRGAFDEMAPETIVEVGLSQSPGAASGTVARRLVLLARLLGHSLIIRMHPTFRQSDVVHANTSRAALIGFIATAGSKRRLVVHLRDAVEPAALGRFNKALLGFVVSRADGVIANSYFTLQTASGYIAPTSLTTVIPSSVGLISPRRIVPPRARVSKIGMLARIADFKGQELLIRSFTDVFRGSDVELELAGSPAFGTNDYMDYLKSITVELGVAEQVKFLGHVSDVWNLIDGWDICVAASLRSEALGQNVLQYLAAGRPTVAPHAGGPAEWIHHNRTGLLFQPGCQDALSSALRELGTDINLRRRLSQNLADERPVPTDVAIRKMFQSFFAQTSQGSR